MPMTPFTTSKIMDRNFIVTLLIPGILFAAVIFFVLSYAHPGMPLGVKLLLSLIWIALPLLAALVKILLHRKK